MVKALGYCKYIVETLRYVIYYKMIDLRCSIVHSYITFALNINSICLPVWIEGIDKIKREEFTI